MLHRETLVAGLLIAVILTALGFAFVSNPRGLRSATEIIWTAFTRLPKYNDALSYGVLMLILTTWLFSGIVFVTEYSEEVVSAWWKRLAIILGLSLVIGVIYWFLHAGGLASMARNTANTMDQVMSQVGRFEGLLTRFYIVLFVLVIGLAAVLPEAKPVRNGLGNTAGDCAPVMLLLVVGLAFYTTSVIQADIVSRLLNHLQKADSGLRRSPSNRANELAPTRIITTLFLGRAYLESAKTLEDVSERMS
jgi:amino acid transporter